MDIFTESYLLVTILVVRHYKQGVDMTSKAVDTACAFGSN